jgi:hypothetical protein
MLYHVRFAALVIAMAVIAPAFSADDKKDTEKKDTEKKPAQNKEKLIPAGMISGKLTKVEVGAKTLKVQVPQPYLNPGNRRIEQRNTEVEYAAADDVQVFYVNPPVEYDEKNRLKKPNTKDVKKPVNGPGGKGYPAEFDNLKKDQVVRIYLGKKKETRTYGKKKDELAEDNKPVVTAVYIVVEPRN